MPDRFTVYFSHRWRPDDVDRNIELWKLLHPRGDLLVDENVERAPALVDGPSAIATERVPCPPEQLVHMLRRGAFPALGLVPA